MTDVTQEPTMAGETSVVHFTDFPFEEKRDHITGDYWPTARDAVKAGYDLDQIWSVVETDGTYCYGPPYHVVNVIGYTATLERHDGHTYYEEPGEED